MISLQSGAEPFHPGNMSHWNLRELSKNTDASVPLPENLMPSNVIASRLRCFFLIDSQK
jgi:hypothetical protein